jgi:hypothetical protein
MDPDQLPASDWRSCHSLQLKETWGFAKWFAAIAFVVGGSTEFYVGYRQFRPPPPPPGTALCGNSVIGGLAMMMIGAPLVAVACSVAGAAIGAALDCVVGGCDS